MKVDLNSGLEGLRGKGDGYVYRKYRGKQIRQKMPTFSGEWGAGTVRQRGNFQAADEWYKKVVRPDPVLVALYRKKGYKRKLNFRQMAIGDYLNPPEVRGIQVITPVLGQPLKVLVHVRDDFEVVRVAVIARDADGHVCRETEAERDEKYFYLTFPLLSESAKPPASIEITAYDRPGNKDTKTFPLVLPPHAPASPGREAVPPAPASAVGRPVEGHAVY